MTVSPSGPPTTNDVTVSPCGLQAIDEVTVLPCGPQTITKRVKAHYTTGWQKAGLEGRTETGFPCTGLYMLCLCKHEKTEAGMYTFTQAWKPEGWLVCHVYSGEKR